MKGSSKQGSNEAYQGKHVVQSQASASNGYTPIQQGEVVVDGTVLQKQRDKKPFIIAAASVIAALLVVYGAGFLYFSSHFFPNTNLNDEDLSMQSSDVLAERFSTRPTHMRLPFPVRVFPIRFSPVKPPSTSMLIKLPKMPLSVRMCPCGLLRFSVSTMFPISS